MYSRTESLHTTSGVHTHTHTNTHTHIKKVHYKQQQNTLHFMITHMIPPHRHTPHLHQQTRARYLNQIFPTLTHLVQSSSSTLSSNDRCCMSAAREADTYTPAISFRHAGSPSPSRTPYRHSSSTQTTGAVCLQHEKQTHIHLPFHSGMQVHLFPHAPRTGTALAPAAQTARAACLQHEQQGMRKAAAASAAAFWF